MRLVLGVSLTASSAVWVLVDTVNGKILAEEVVALDSLQEIARATARSVQAFDVQTEHDVEGVRMTWSDDARQHGIRLRTKLRLFGFETVETVSQDAARQGRNKTARHLAPHLALAYGAARSDLNADETRNVFQRLTARVPTGAAVAVFAAAVVGVGLYAFLAASPSSEAPQTTAADSAPAQTGQPVGPVTAATPAAAPVAAPKAAPAALPAPQSAAGPVVQPADVSEPVAAWQPATIGLQPGYVPVPEVATEIALDSVVPETLPAEIGEPHLPAVLPVAGPVQEPVTVVPGAVPPPPPPPSVLSSLFSALP